MLNGMTAWLESIDQKAGELAERQKVNEEGEKVPGSGRSHANSLGSGSGGGGAKGDGHEAHRVRHTSSGEHEYDDEGITHSALERRLRDVQQQQPSALPFPAGPSLATAATEVHDEAEEQHKDEQRSHASSSSSSSVLPDEVAPLPLLSRERGVDALKLQCASLQQELQDHTEEMQAMERDLATRTARLRELERQGAELQDRLRQEQQELVAARAQLRQSEATHLQDEQTLHMLQEQQQATQREFDAYKAQSRHLLEEKERRIRELMSSNRSSGGSGAGNDKSEHGTDNTSEHAATTAASAEAEVVRLRHSVETLQGQLRAMKAEAATRAQEHDTAQRTLQTVRAEKEQLATRVAALAMELQAAQEALDGEVEAHKATSATLRALQGQPAQQSSTEHMSAAGHGIQPLYGEDEASLLTSSTELAKCQEALAETTQRCQLLSYQLTQKQIALDASERHAAELQSRYQEVMCLIDDETVAAEAGYNNANNNNSSAAGGGNSKSDALSGAYSRHTALPSYSSHRLAAMADSTTTAVPVLRHREERMQPGSAGANTYNNNNNNSSNASGRGGPVGVAMPVQELRRTRPMMVLLSRRTRLSRGLGAVLGAMDGAVLRVMRVLALWPLARLLLLCLVVLYVLSFLSLAHSPAVKEAMAATLAEAEAGANGEDAAMVTKDVIEGTQQAA